MDVDLILYEIMIQAKFKLDLPAACKSALAVDVTWSQLDCLADRKKKRKSRRKCLLFKQGIWNLKPSVGQALMTSI